MVEAARAANIHDFITSLPEVGWGVCVWGGGCFVKIMTVLSFCGFCDAFALVFSLYTIACSNVVRMSYEYKQTISHNASYVPIPPPHTHTHSHTHTHTHTHSHTHACTHTHTHTHTHMHTHTHRAMTQWLVRDARS